MHDLGTFRANLDAIARTPVHARTDAARRRIPRARQRAAAPPSPRPKQLRAEQNLHVARGRADCAKKAPIRPNCSSVRAKWATGSPRLQQSVEEAGCAVPRAAGRRTEHAARIGAGGEIGRRQRRDPHVRRARAHSISNRRRIGISDPTWAFSISTAPRKSPARDLPSTSAWARSWSAR